MSPSHQLRAYDSPDLLLFDIDPEPPLSFDDTIDVAHTVHDRLEGAGIRLYVKTSGKKGLHIVVPLVPGYRFEEIRTFAHSMGKAIARDTNHVVAEFPHSQDPGTIFIDYLQNAHGKTMAAPYSLRATDGATVSTPLTWEELKRGIRPEDFNIRTMLSGSRDHGGTSLTTGKKSEDKPVHRSAHGRAKKSIAGGPVAEPVPVTVVSVEPVPKKAPVKTLVIPKPHPDEPVHTGKAGRPFWSGSITIGLVNVPVRLHTMVRDRSFSFRLLHREDGQPLRY